jgi:hypothetical protein
VEASNAAARWATETDPIEWEKARKTFWRLYWGPLDMVEDRNVESAMVKLGGLVRRDPVPQGSIPMPQLQQPSLALAHAARDLILASWNVTLEPLQGKN